MTLFILAKRASYHHVPQWMTYQQKLLIAACIIPIFRFVLVMLMELTFKLYTERIMFSTEVVRE
ncbi:unnamed protein product [Rhodiola kirilowii]